jgi:hypothetical protein
VRASDAGVSIVVEWDNVRLAGASRARSMLERLRDEIGAAGGRVLEVLLVHDGRSGEVAAAEDVLAPGGAEVVAVPAPGCDYYGLKNAGARETRGELVVFVDCDVVPEPGWLGALLAPFADPSVAVVAGATYLEPAGLWGRSMALASVFELPREDGRVERTERFFANSLAFRRETALAFPFPPVAGTSRASCVLLAHQLAEANAVVVVNPAARASHPAPAGVRHAAARALVHGRDTVLLAEAGAGPPVTVGAGLHRLARMVRSAVRDRRALGLSWSAMPAAVAISLGYYALAATGALLTRVAPTAARRLEL